MKTLNILIILCGFTSTSLAQIGNHYLDLKSPSDWHLSSVPFKQIDIFPESYLQNDLTIGFNRAKICWYSIDPLFVITNSMTPPYITHIQQENHLVRPILFNEVYPNSTDSIMVSVLNLAYYPYEKGPYNFDIAPTLYSNGISIDGNLNSPELRWGGIMRNIPKNTFTTNNLNYLGFWVMDPFVYDTASDGGRLYIDIGTVSEDLLKDGKRANESELPATSTVVNVDTTIWGRVSTLTFPVDTFANDSSRQFQDIGLDGLNDNDEQLFFQNYLISIANSYGTSSQAYAEAMNDPCSDDYHFYRGTDYDNAQVDIFNRYKKYNGPEGNSGVFSQESYPTAVTPTLPDDEDLNGNDILDTAENYFQYKVLLNPDSLIVGQNFITDKITVNPANGDGTPVTWYKFLIPLNTIQRKVIGNINNLDSSGFVRLFLKDFSHTVNLRFFELAFVTNDLTKINEIQSNYEISVYPNPAKEQLNFTLPYLNNDIKVVLRIFNAMGIQLSEKVFTGSEYVLNTSNLSNGVYYYILEMGYDTQKGSFVIIQ
jgi:cell surface protein SprA